MAQIYPYIHFAGNAQEAFDFYKSVFGGEYNRVAHFSDLPANPNFPIEEKDLNRIMHISLPIGNGDFLMGSDTHPLLGELNLRENRSKILVATNNKEEADKIYNGLSEGGEVEMPIQDSPWGSYFGMFRDKYGIEWMISFDY